MAIVLKKGSVFMKGHSGATGFRTRFRWTSDINKARRFLHKNQAESLRQESKSVAVKVPSAKKELQQLGKLRTKYGVL